MPARPTGRGSEHAMMEKLLSDLKLRSFKDRSSAWPFLELDAIPLPRERQGLVACACEGMNWTTQPGI
ncbi:hypothetical protein BD309DRAFT_974560 [Dichomitus squalens]|uniref:Uncharacterized protein n=1 Tax=Dichomitus squalens TaxID=114155 RepID=A0A4Q9PCN6_9APHY|nr:hypothetical protein BD309DRAFT_974560 [Dichomitus squalens]TBU51795.1 hypothetical protein BD310DRAFT_941586 [Dichomitus squalens]